MISYYKKVNGEKIPSKIKDYNKRCWVHAVEPDENEINILVDKFNLEKENIIDGLDIFENPRFEDEGGNIYLYLSVPTTQVPDEATSSFLIVITKFDVVTISKYHLEIFENIQKGKVHFLTSNRSSLVLRLLSLVAKNYDINTRKILREVRKDRNYISNLKNKDILDLVLQEDILNDYLSSFAPLIDIYNKLLKNKSLRFPKDDQEFIEDLINDLKQTFYSCRAALKSISNMRDYYSTTLSINLNRVIRILTIFTIFLTIPTIISSIYGMNILLPAQNNSNIFAFLIILIISIWVLLFFIFKKIKII
ncbi:MAG: CorA family divalent cation transporter [archaeon]